MCSVFTIIFLHKMAALFHLLITFVGLESIMAEGEQQCRQLAVYTEDAKQCHFPVNYPSPGVTEVKTRTFHSCTSYDLSDDQDFPWCSYASKLARDAKHGEWGFCDIPTVGGTAPEGSKCLFPFWYDGKYYRECTYDHETLSPFKWCKTEKDPEWGYCAEPPMDSCAYDMINKSTTERSLVDVSTTTQRTLELETFDFFIMNFNTVDSESYACIVYHKKGDLPRLRHYVLLSKSSVAHSTFHIYNCVNADHCGKINYTTDKRLPVGDLINLGYLKYIFSKQDDITNGKIVISVYENTNISIMCSSDTHALKPETATGMDDQKIQEHVDEGASQGSTYAIFGLSVLGGIAVIVAVTMVIVVLLLKQKRQQNTTKYSGPVPDSERTENAYTTDAGDNATTSPVNLDDTGNDGDPYSYIAVGRIQTKPASTPSSTSNKKKEPGGLYELEQLPKKRTAQQGIKGEVSGEVPQSDMSEYDTKQAYVYTSQIAMQENDVYSLESD